jgi:hypothetical protein
MAVAIEESRTNLRRSAPPPRVTAFPRVAEGPGTWCSLGGTSVFVTDVNADSTVSDRPANNVEVPEPPEDSLRPFDVGPSLWGAPLMHFQSGGSSPFRRELVRAFSDAGDYARVSEMIRTPAEPLTPFQYDNLNWILAVVRGGSDEEGWRARAKSSAQTAEEDATYEENRVFQLIHALDLPTAKRRARAALAIYPTCHGLWINLLVTVNRVDGRQAAERMLVELCRVVKIDGGLIDVYLHREPNLRRSVCNGG